MVKISFDPVRVAILGAGARGRQHAQLVVRNPHTELVGVADPYTDAVAFDYGIRHYSEHRTLLRSERPDAVIIATPNHLHVPLALDALEFGAAVLLEAPIAPGYAEARPLVSAAARSHLPVLVAHQRRYDPTVAAVRRAILDGGIGRLVAVSGVWLARRDESYFEEQWHCSSGAGVVLMDLIHELDLLRYMCGEIDTVQAMVSNTVRHLAVEDTAAVAIRFENGALGSLVASDAAVAPRGADWIAVDGGDSLQSFAMTSLHVTGTRGALSLPGSLGLAGNGFDPGPGIVTDTLTVVEPLMRQQLDHFVEVVRGQVAPRVPIQDAIRSLAAASSIQAAARSGRALLASDGALPHLADERRTP